MISAALAQEVSQLEAELCFALADPTRILILYALGEKPRNVTELTVELGIPQPSTSRHLRILRDHQLVHANRQGTTVTYQLADRRLLDALDILRSVLRERITHRANLMEEIAIKS